MGKEKKKDSYLLVNLIASPFYFYISGLLTSLLAGRVTVNFFECLSVSVSSVVGISIIVILLGCFNWFLYKYIFPSDDAGILDEERNFIQSNKGTYGTSGWMTKEEQDSVLNRSDSETTSEIILGKNIDDGSVITIPSDARMNKHIAVYGASGTGKSRAFARNYILQAAARGESMIVTDPKGELYESMSAYLRKDGYDVKVFNLVNLQHSDSWNCLAETEGDDLKTQVFADVIIQNTGSGNDFWGQCEMMLLKALCLYVLYSPALDSTMAEVYNLLTTKTQYELDNLFDALPYNDETSAMISAYNIFKKSSDNVKGGVIIGLGSRLQIFQGNIIRKITEKREIDIVKPGREKCAYFCITSDQHGAFDFLAVLFYSMLFIKLVEFADSQPGCRCPVPVNFILDEFPNIGAIPDFTKKISTVRSRGLNICVIFQNIAQLQNRYPKGLWEEILGNCDTHLFLGCTDETTAEFISKQTGIVTVGVSSRSSDEKEKLFNSSPSKKSESVGKRALLNADEVRRLLQTEELILIRGQKPLKALKYDYSNHPKSKELTSSQVSEYIPNWRKEFEQQNNIQPPTQIKQNVLNDDAEFNAPSSEQKLNNDDLLNSIVTRPKRNKPKGF